jgi:hypothetical protein
VYSTSSPDDGLRPHLVSHQIVAIQRDVERAGRHVDAGDGLQMPGDAGGDRDAAGANADERHVFEAAVVFEDFVRDARQASGDAIGVHDDDRSSHMHLFAASQGGIKEQTNDITAGFGSRASR